MTETETNPIETLAVERSKQALRLATASLPHLAGLARLARIKATSQVPVAAVAASGLVLVNPNLFANMPLSDAAYVLAHELLHLALDTHGRQGRADHLIANFAHDYIINDILTNELGRDPPLGGLYSEHASEQSFEDWIVQLNQDRSMSSYGQCWATTGGVRKFPGSSESSTVLSPMARALAEAGLTRIEPPKASLFDDDLIRGDLIPKSRESDFEPELAPQSRQSSINKIRKAATKAASLAELKEKIKVAARETTVEEVDRVDAMIEVVRNAYHTPWQLAMQRWMDAMVPGNRTYARPSRRGADRTDVVLPGRNRQGWTLHIILDTSGSMEDYFSAALGAIAYFCESSGVADIHLVQCDTEVTRDEWLDPVGLAEFKVAGFGYSDMRPAMHHLANDPEVSAALILTDGYIEILANLPPYSLLWVLLGAPDFNPPYGQVVHLLE
jgi:predicted metal-dependent peptidase